MPRTLELVNVNVLSELLNKKNDHMGLKVTVGSC